MRVLYNRHVVTAGDAASGVTLDVDVPPSAVIRRVEVHLTQLPPAYPDASTAIADICSIVESDTVDSSTWLFGQETITARQPVSWQGKLKVGDQFHGKVFCSFQGLTAGNQIELAVTIE